MVTNYYIDPIFFELSKNFLDPVHCAAGRQIEAAMAWMAAVCLLQTQAHCVQGEYHISIEIDDIAISTTALLAKLGLLKSVHFKKTLAKSSFL